MVLRKVNRTGMGQGVRMDGSAVASLLPRERCRSSELDWTSSIPFGAARALAAAKQKENFSRIRMRQLVHMHGVCASYANLSQRTTLLCVDLRVECDGECCVLCELRALTNSREDPPSDEEVEGGKKRKRAR